MLDLTQQRIVVTGGAGFLGRRVWALLRAQGVPDERLFIPRRTHYDLTQLDDVKRLYADARPTVVLHLAAEVGGIGANRRHPGRFFFANLAMGLNLIEVARQRGLRKFLQVGSVCAYPKLTPVPFREDDLWNGYPEETNAPYGVAKKALFVMLDAYQREFGLASSVVIPVNLYGPGDNFDPESSHFIPALIRRCETARLRGEPQVVAWGTGRASREFLFVDDAARGIVAAAERIETPDPINLGTGTETVLCDLAALIAQVCGFSGRIAWDASMPDGQPRRQLDVTRAENLLNWRAEVSLDDGLRQTLDWWRKQPEAAAKV